MPWSITIGRIAGTDVRIHATFLLLLAFIGLSGALQGGVARATDGIIFAVLVFACVLLHEFGHIFAARRYGIRTPDVMLWPFGGVASLERMPDKPAQELVVALAGPLVNVAIAAVLMLVIGAGVDMHDLNRIEDIERSLLGRLAGVNIALVVFNLIPAFPMDGGRVLRALLAMRMGQAPATRLAARIGQGLALLLALAGFFVNPMLILIGVFVFFAAGAEAEGVALRALADGLRVRDAMLRAVVTLPATATLGDAVDALISTSQKEFPIAGADGAVLGILTRDRLVIALKSLGESAMVTEAMVTDVPAIAFWQPLQAGLDLLERSGAPAIIVLNAQGQFQGLVTPENIGEMLLLENARPGTGFAHRG